MCSFGAFGANVGLLGLLLAAEPAALAREPVRSFLNMPWSAGGKAPALLSQTGAFEDVTTLKISPGLIPYGLNVPFWSDGAEKTRWVALPNDASARMQKVIFSEDGPWIFPSGSVFVKHFEIALDETRPEVRRRLETRLIVRDERGGVYGVTYKWRANNSDAELLPGSLSEPLLIKTATGVRTQIWYYPSREDCKTCHTPINGGVLGPNTRQLNCDFEYSPGKLLNQVGAWNESELFDTHITRPPGELVKLAKLDDTHRSIEERARSWLDANCAHCHLPGGTVANFDARYTTPLNQQRLLNGEVLIDEGMDGARAIVPKDLWRSIVYFRINTVDANRMPPLAHNRIDEAGATLVREWIQSLPGQPVLPPPTISPTERKLDSGTRISLAHAEPGVALHYTLDGSAPSKSDPVYEGPLALTNTCVVRVRAYKAGFGKSIPAQQVYVITE